MQSVLGTILDPAADKILMTTLVLTFTLKGFLPRMFIQFTLERRKWLTWAYSVPLAVVIIGRDVLLSLSAFYIRYTSLPVPVRSHPAGISAFLNYFVAENLPAILGFLDPICRSPPYTNKQSASPFYLQLPF